MSDVPNSIAAWKETSAEGGFALPLSCLFAGQRAIVQSIVGGQELVRHLQELGIRAGASLEMIRPGGTCILRVGGSKLCVRGDELLSVMVTPCELGPCELGPSELGPSKLGVSVA